MSFRAGKQISFATLEAITRFASAVLKKEGLEDVDSKDVQHVSVGDAKIDLPDDGAINKHR